MATSSRALSHDARLETGRESRRQHHEERDGAEPRERQRRAERAPGEVAQRIADGEHQVGRLHGRARADARAGRAPGPIEATSADAEARERGPKSNTGRPADEVDAEALDAERHGVDREEPDDGARPERSADAARAACPRRPARARASRSGRRSSRASPSSWARVWALMNTVLPRISTTTPTAIQPSKRAKSTSPATSPTAACDERLLRLRVGRRLVGPEALVDAPRERFRVHARPEPDEELGRLAHEIARLLELSPRGRTRCCRAPAPPPRRSRARRGRSTTPGLISKRTASPALMPRRSARRRPTSAPFAGALPARQVAGDGRQPLDVRERHGIDAVEGHEVEVAAARVDVDERRQHGLDALHRLEFGA